MEEFDNWELVFELQARGVRIEGIFLVEDVDLVAKDLGSPIVDLTDLEKLDFIARAMNRRKELFEEYKRRVLSAIEDELYEHAIDKSDSDYLNEE